MDVTSTKFLAAIEADILRAQIFELGVLLIALILSAWITYIVIKAAIRDGINESGLVRNSWERTVERHETRKSDLPEMRAD
ncbi:hypothetical protein SAMN05216303_101446 [Rhodoferax sp. OV413]|uniref:hypothetical protein n=1 Tax=Rhodoferax sp. OV413 TaxID=1855285 RepID=UPI00088890E3|nr:hypothetical protein [Rhodoferax sp. OV413]SDO08238.1 hypothetical protein SAMN05216303_101446 [Rhodoferax sp. OV413]